MESLRQTLLSAIQQIFCLARKQNVYPLFSSRVNKEIDAIFQAFVKLRRMVQRCDVLENLDTRAVFGPFLLLIRSEKVSGTLTQQALEGLHVLLKQCPELLDFEKNTTMDAVGDIVDAVTQCRFQAGDVYVDEKILVLVLQVLETIITSRAGLLLYDNVVWQIVETCYGICLPSKQKVPFSPFLQLLANTTLHNMVRYVFYVCIHGREGNDKQNFGLPCIVKIFGFLCQKIQSTTKANEDESYVPLSLLHCALETAGTKLIENDSLLSFIKDDVCEVVLRRGRLGYRYVLGMVCTNMYSSFSSTQVVVLCLQIVRVLWSNVRQLLKMQLEAIFNGIFIHAIHWVLGQLENPHVLEDEFASLNSDAHEILECMVDLLAEPTILPDLFVNFDCDERRSNVMEDLFTYMSDIIKKAHQYIVPEKDNRKNEFRQQMAAIALDGIFNALWVLYSRSQEAILLENPASSKATLHRANRVSVDYNGCLKNFESAEILWHRRQQKKLIKQGTALFNEKANTGLQFLQKHSVLPTPLTAQEVAKFLRSMPPGLDKASIGTYLGAVGKEEADAYEGDTVEFHTQVLAAYVNSFNFSGHSLLDSLRMFLASFRLPGEAQQIDRILNSYASKVHEQCNDRTSLASIDVAYLLSFSIIMLNTDLHNPNIKEEKKMSLPAFHRNNKNYGEEVSKGQDLPLHLLDSIYASIQAQEIRTCSDEGATCEVTSDRWKDLLHQAASDPTNSNLIVHSRSNRISNQAQDSSPVTNVDSGEKSNPYDAQIFKSLWPLMTSAFSAVFDSYSVEEYYENQLMELQLASNGFVLCAAVASHMEFVDDFNQLFCQLCQKTMLKSKSVDMQSVSTVDAITQFYSDRAAQVATAAMLTLTNTCADSLVDGWLVFIFALIRLREFKALPSSLTRFRNSFLSKSDREAFLASANTEGNRRRATSFEKNKMGRGGFLDSFASLFSQNSEVQPDLPIDLTTNVNDIVGIAEEGPETESEENRRMSRDWIISSLKPFELDRIIPNSVNISNESLQSFISHLIAVSESVTLPPVRTNPKDATNGNESTLDPEFRRTPGGSIFAEHLLIEIVLLNANRALQVWPYLYQHYKRIFSLLCPLIKGNLTVNGLEYENSTYFLSIAAQGLIKIGNSLAAFPNGDVNYFDLFFEMDKGMLPIILPQVAAGVLSRLQSQDPPIHVSEWGPVVCILEQACENAMEVGCIHKIIPILLDEIVRPEVPILAMARLGYTMCSFESSDKDHLRLLVKILSVANDALLNLMNANHEKHTSDYLQVQAWLVTCTVHPNSGVSEEALATLAHKDIPDSVESVEAGNIRLVKIVKFQLAAASQNGISPESSIEKVPFELSFHATLIEQYAFALTDGLSKYYESVHNLPEIWAMMVQLYSHQIAKAEDSQKPKVLSNIQDAVQLLTKHKLLTEEALKETWKSFEKNTQDSEMLKAILPNINKD